MRAEAQLSAPGDDVVAQRIPFQDVDAVLERLEDLLALVHVGVLGGDRAKGDIPCMAELAIGPDLAQTGEGVGADAQLGAQGGGVVEAAQPVDGRVPGGQHLAERAGQDVADVP